MIYVKFMFNKLRKTLKSFVEIPNKSIKKFKKSMKSFFYRQKAYLIDKLRFYFLSKIAVKC